MPEIRPFAAIRFDHTRSAGDLSALISPPYDVLDGADKTALLAKNARNFVAIDLPHIPPKSAGPTEAYQQAARLLQENLTAGAMLREPQPALYAYHQVFSREGTTFTRRMFIARLRLQPFSDGSILPHEQTFGGPKEDRLALMKATECQLSPIFGLYSDPEDRVGRAFARTEADAPDVTARMGDVKNRVWIVADTGVIDTVTTALADQRVFIADGHHRYGTALMYRDWLIKEEGGSIPDDHPANYIMFVLASMDDPGCLILPYHRALAEIELSTVLSAWSDGTSQASSESEADIVLVDGDTGRRAPLNFTNRAALRSLEPGHCDAWYDLDYAYLHRYLIEELLAGKLGADPKVRYVKSVDHAARVARDESGVALLVKATPMAILRAVSEAGELMPQKSTYFFPKLATGLAINPIAAR